METDLLCARIADTAEICERTNKPKFFGFLSAEQAVLAEKILQNRNISHHFFGGYDCAQRVMLGCFPDWAENFSFPISAITFTYRKSDSLSHRDFLGSLMVLGLKREAVGDILVENGRAVAFLNTEIKNFVLNEVSKIGRTGVTLSEGFYEPLPQVSRLTEVTDTVASNRLDCIVSSVASVSRNTANELIESGFVSVNSVISQKSTKLVSEGDILTVRGKGKFIISSLSARTKKQRTVLVYQKYI